jgi:hypothetical protein
VSKRERVAATVVVAVLHLFALGPAIEGDSVAMSAFLRPGEGVLEGALPYEDLDYEYPPLSLPVVIAPALIADSEPSYRAAFGWEMFLVDLAVIALLALTLPDRRRTYGALATYAAGIVLLSNLGPLPDSDIDGQPLAFARFDLLLGALVLAAALARLGSRSATWSLLLSTGVAVKFFPLFLYPSFLRDERRPRRVLLAGLVPLALAAAIVIVPGDEFGSAISYHTGRDLQIESLGATPHLLAHLLFDRDTYVDFSGGSYNVVTGHVSTTRTLSIVLFFVAWTAVVVAGWRRRVPPLQIATAILAVMVLFAPVLSPQFLFWLLPVSAAAYGLRLPNLLLMAAVLATQFFLDQYGRVGFLEDGFIIPIAVRNALLVAYTVAVAVYAFREPDPRPEPSLQPGHAPA